MPNPSVAWYTKSPHAYNAKHRQMHTRSRCRAVLFNSVLPHLVGCDSPRLKQANGAACDRFRVILRGVDDLWKCLWGALDHMMIPCEMPRYKYHVAWTLLAISLTSWTCPNSVPSFFLWGHLVESHSYMICIYIYRIQVLPCQVQTNAFGEIQILAGHTPFPHIFHSIKCFCSYLYYSIPLYLYYSSSTA